MKNTKILTLLMASSFIALNVYAMEEGEDYEAGPIQARVLGTHADSDNEPEGKGKAKEKSKKKYKSATTQPPNQRFYTNASEWVIAMQEWASESYALNTSHPNAQKLQYKVRFEHKDDDKRHVTTLSAIPYFNDGETEVKGDPIEFEFKHKVSNIQQGPVHNSFLFNGFELFNGQKITADYCCPAVPESGIEDLAFGRTDNLSDYETNGLEIGCKALKADKEPGGYEDDYILEGWYHKTEMQKQLVSPFIYSDGRSLYMTRRIKLVCRNDDKKNTGYIFEYIESTKHELKLKKDFRIKSKSLSSQGLSPEGLHEWKEGKWCKVDHTFKPIGNPFRIRSSDNGAYFQHAAFDPTVSINQIIKDFHYTPYLTTLDLSNRDFRTVPKELCMLTRLTTLNLNKNGLISLPDEMSRLTGLTTLHLDTNPIRSLPDLPELETLTLNYNGLSSLPSGFSRLTKLTNLHLGANNLTSMPEEILNLRSLTYLNLNANKLTSIPDKFCDLTGLKYLEFHSNNQISLPARFGNLVGLIYLDLSHNQLATLPDVFRSFDSLKTLNLNNNKLSSLPLGFEGLIGLTTLRLDINMISTLPIALGGLRSLTSLNLNRNQLKSIPSSIGSLTNLRTLEIGENPLSAVPAEIFSLSGLTTLNLSATRLISLPDTLCNLTNLTTLGFTTNPLTKLPDEIGRLASLTYLASSYTGLLSLPESFGNLTKLKILHLNHNQLSRIPHNFINLTNLTTLHLEANPFQVRPEASIAQNVKERRGDIHL